MRLGSALLVVCSAGMSLVAQTGPNLGPVQPVPFHQVELEDGFWLPRLRLNHEHTIPFALRQSEETGRIRNFEVAGGLVKGTFNTIYPFDDSDVYKIIEGASYSLQVFPDARLAAQLDEIIAKIAAAQEPDGYLYTNRTILGPRAHEWAGSRRWELVHRLSHELYNLGHLFEAAAAHHQAIGKRTLLEVAFRAADLLLRDFGWGKEEKYPGHQEVELGLVKLYRLTGRREYLDLARFFLDVRGPGGDPYNQAHQKVWEQSEAVGHAVRANYMYSAMADVAALTGDSRYLAAADRIWTDVVSHKIYITGGVGSTASGEAYGAAYQLPNLTAYCETCASIANVMWNHRMFLAHGDSRYLDVAERTLYNALLSGLALSGDRFFYPNPLESDGSHERSPWFGCACCPSNLTRFLPSLPGYVYGLRGKRLFVNLYVQSRARIQLDGQPLEVSQSTDYPWNGEVRVVLHPRLAQAFELALRLPGWARGEAMTGDLYRFVGASGGRPRILVNGAEVTWQEDAGFAVLVRQWQAGDEVRLLLPMEVRLVRAHPAVEADRGRLALQRGPLVYCAEWPDNPGRRLAQLTVGEASRLDYQFDPKLLNGVGVISVSSRSPAAAGDQPWLAIPYYAWANRGKGEMLVWIRETGLP
ncbi:MAG: glycoside hydrolase family 127 protein [Acidobacteriota bacterium]